MNGVRKFEFETNVSFGAIMRTIVAALADEGLVLHDGNSRDRVSTVIIGGRKVAIVPNSRIVGAPDGR
jgi:hypothetical protein